MISFWFTEGADCLPTQDVVDELAGRLRGAGQLPLDQRPRRPRRASPEIVDERGWRVPVGWDGDGAVSNLYRVGVCPTVAFAYPGGLLSEAAIGGDALTEEQLTADVERLLRESERRASGGPVSGAAEPGPELGWLAAELREEFPGLGLRYLIVERGSGRSTREVKERLRVLSDRFAGAQAINLRHQPIPWAYRVFFRHIGLDPDEQRTPVEELALERMKHGGFAAAACSTTR